MQNLAKHITDKLVESNVIDAEDRELYVYGFWQGFILIINYIGIILIGLLFQMLWQSILFTISYSVLRTSAGGYHARTQKNCYLLSLLLVTLALLFIRFISWNEILFSILLLFSAVTVFILAPVEDENKPLDEVEQKVYKRRSRVRFLLLFLITIIITGSGHLSIASCIVIAIFTSAIMLILGKLNNTYWLPRRL